MASHAFKVGDHVMIAESAIASNGCGDYTGTLVGQILEVTALGNNTEGPYCYINFINADGCQDNNAFYEKCFEPASAELRQALRDKELAETHEFAFQALSKLTSELGLALVRAEEEDDDA